MKSTLWKRKLSSSGLLYVILDLKSVNAAGKNIFRLADRLTSYGADIIQLRAVEITDKDCLRLASKLAKIVRKRNKIFLVNNRADIALLSKSDGLHLGDNDIPPQAARRLLGSNAIIGQTIHSLAELKNSPQTSLDYLSIGPVFKTPLKPHLPPLGLKKLEAINKKTSKLTFAIGGINLYNIASLTAVGINNVAVGRGIILTSSSLNTTLKKYKQCLKKAS